MHIGRMKIIRMEERISRVRGAGERAQFPSSHFRVARDSATPSHYRDTIFRPRSEESERDVFPAGRVQNIRSPLMLTLTSSFGRFYQRRHYNRSKTRDNFSERDAPRPVNKLSASAPSSVNCTASYQRRLKLYLERGVVVTRRRGRDEFSRRQIKTIASERASGRADCRGSLKSHALGAAT